MPLYNYINPTGLNYRHQNFYLIQGHVVHFAIDLQLLDPQVLQLIDQAANPSQYAHSFKSDQVASKGVTYIQHGRQMYTTLATAVPINAHPQRPWPRKRFSTSVKFLK